MIAAAALAHVALTKCKWRHPSNCRQKGSRGPTVGPAITGSIKAKLPLRFVGPIYQPHARKRASVREGKCVARRFESRSPISHVDPRLFWLRAAETEGEDFRIVLSRVEGINTRPSAAANILFVDKLRSHR